MSGSACSSSASPCSSAGKSRAHPGHAAGRDHPRSRLRRPVRRRGAACRARTIPAQRGDLHVTRGGAPVTRLTSERRFFPVERMPTTEAGIRARPAARPLRRPRRPGRTRAAWTVRALPQPAGALDLGRRRDHGAGGARVAHRPAPPRRRAAPGAAARRARPRGRPDVADRDAQSSTPAAGGACSSSSLPLLVFAWSRRLPGARPHPRPQRAAVGAGRQAGAGSSTCRRSPGRDEAGLKTRRPARQADAGQRVRLLVRAVPDRAPVLIRAQGAGRDGPGHRLQGPAGGRDGLARGAGRPVPAKSAPTATAAVAIDWGVYGVPETFVIDKRRPHRLPAGRTASSRRTSSGRSCRCWPSWSGSEGSPRRSSSTCCSPARRWPPSRPTRCCPTRRSRRAPRPLGEELRCLVCQNQSIDDFERRPRARPAPPRPRADLAAGDGDSR